MNLDLGGMIFIASHCHLIHHMEDEAKQIKAEI